MSVGTPGKWQRDRDHTCGCCVLICPIHPSSLYRHPPSRLAPRTVQEGLLTQGFTSPPPQFSPQFSSPAAAYVRSQVELSKGTPISTPYCPEDTQHVGWNLKIGGRLTRSRRGGCLGGLLACQASVAVSHPKAWVNIAVNWRRLYLLSNNRAYYYMVFESWIFSPHNSKIYLF